MNSVCSKASLRILITGSVLVAVFARASFGAKERFYTMGDNDPGAVVGGTPPVSTEVTPNRPATRDTVASTTDYGSSDTASQVNVSLVPLISPNVNFAPHYVSASDRPGALPGNLALFFDGGDIMYNVRPPSAAAYMAFDPRNFGGDFATLSQAWVKPAVATTEQFVFRAGNEIGGAMITSPDGVNGFWTLRTGNPSAEVEVGEVQIVSAVPVVPGAWTHVAVFRGGNQSLFYINGHLAAVDNGFWSSEGTAPILGSADPVNGGSFFTGAIDNFSVGTPDGFDPELELDYFADKAITFSGVTGDVDQDGDVDRNDYDIWSTNVGLNNQLGFGDPNTLLLGDVNQSGTIDLRDYQIIKANLMPGAGASGSLPAHAATPEPGALVLAATAIVATLGARTRRRNSARWTVMVFVVVAGSLAGHGAARAELVVAEDFYYDGPSKLLHVGGGFAALAYRGGQNGSAGSWNANWGQVGDGIITTPDFTPPIDPFNDLPEPVAEPYVALYDGFFGVQSELFRGFDLSDSVSPTQTLYFGGRFRIDLDIGTDGNTVPQFYAPRLFLNRIAGDDRKFDINGVEFETQRDRSQDIGLGIQVDPVTQQSVVVARLGSDESNKALEAVAPITTAPPTDGQWHTLVGKFEVSAGDHPVGDYNNSGFVDAADYTVWRDHLGGNAAALANRDPASMGNVSTADYNAWKAAFGNGPVGGGGNRLTVWFDPTGVETGGTMVQLESEVLTDLTSLVGQMHAQGSVPMDEYVSEPELGRSYLDDLAIGTSWNDVANVDVPRLTLEINTSNGTGKIINGTGTTFHVDGYSIESESDSLNGTGWLSLDEQGIDGGGWEQNLASSSQLVETFLDGSHALAPGAELPLGSLFSLGGMRDIAARYSTAETLLNLFKVQYVPAGSASTITFTAVPEPTTLWLTAFVGIALTSAGRGKILAMMVRRYSIG